jgi:hypothetical protein
MNPWERLQAALGEMEAWYHHDASMSAFVGVQADGHYFCGANVDAEPWSDDLYGEGMQYQVDGDSPEAVIDQLIARFASYRADMDKQWAEDEEAAVTAEGR